MTPANRRLERARPLLRAGIRYSPIESLRMKLWYGLVEPHLAWQSHRFVARTRFGARLAGDTRDILQQYVYYFGTWEPSLTAFLCERLGPGDVFVDVGANVGYFTLLGARRVGERGRVVAIEPSPRLFAALEANARRNRVRNARMLQCAVLDQSGVVKLYAGTPHHSGLTTTRPERGLQPECEVRAAPLGELLDAEELARARVVKIDVEGAELAAVAGLEPLFGHMRDDLEVVVEVDEELLEAQGRSAAELVAVFARAGFHPYLLENDYMAHRYLERRPPARPERLRGPVQGVADLVFARIDAERL